MKRFFITMISLLVIFTARFSANAQEVTIDLFPGWTYIAYPYPTTVALDTFFSSITPMNGDKIAAQNGYSTYMNGRWRGSVTILNPGEGYHYFSNNTEIVTLVLDNPIVPEQTITVTTGEPTDITAESATVGGEVTLLTDTHVFMRGVCWGTASDPDIDGSYFLDGAGEGLFIVTLYELTPNTTYYIRAYAVSDNGLAYGEEQSFTTLDNGGGTVPTGAINGLFSVSADQQVYFSQGNLQYQASTDTWKFAENQYDYVGSTNSNISSSYSGWIDLFGWGTSGYHDANDPHNVNYQPWSTSTSEVSYSYNGNGYGPSTNMTDPNLTGTSSNYDWGVYNPISNGGNQAGQWRTLTQAEWQYVFNTRSTTSGIRYAKANVNNVNGVILLPDNWSTSTYNLSSTNTSDASFSSNTLTASQWITLESAGAVFLPAAGLRSGTDVYGFGSGGIYWSASCISQFTASNMGFWDSSLDTGSNSRYGGHNVRLVRVAE